MHARVSIPPWPTVAFVVGSLGVRICILGLTDLLEVSELLVTLPSRRQLVARRRGSNITAHRYSMSESCIVTWLHNLFDAALCGP
jgi:hypothetical protein